MHEDLRDGPRCAMMLVALAAGISAYIKDSGWSVLIGGLQIISAGH
jgi:hypothetical protein